MRGESLEAETALFTTDKLTATRNEIHDLLVNQPIRDLWRTRSLIQTVQGKVKDQSAEYGTCMQDFGVSTMHTKFFSLLN